MNLPEPPVTRARFFIPMATMFLYIHLTDLTEVAARP